jgi:hypothetical protein
MSSQEPRQVAQLNRRIDQNLKKLCQAQFGHVLTLEEWKALPFALRRELDKQARQQANNSGGQR